MDEIMINNKGHLGKELGYDKPVNMCLEERL